MVSRSDFIVATLARADIPLYETNVIVANMPIATMTIKSSTIEKALRVLELKTKRKNLFNKFICLFHSLEPWPALNKIN